MSPPERPATLRPGVCHDFGCASMTPDRAAESARPRRATQVAPVEGVQDALRRALPRLSGAGRTGARSPSDETTSYRIARNVLMWLRHSSGWRKKRKGRRWIHGGVSQREKDAEPAAGRSPRTPRSRRSPWPLPMKVCRCPATRSNERTHFAKGGGIREPD